MATTRQFAYNNSDLITGTVQVGTLSVGIPTSGFTNNPQFWTGPDEELGYVIAKPISGNTQPTPLGGVFASVGFNRTKTLTEEAFINLAEYTSVKNNTPQTFTTGNQASAWLTNNGYWNSWSGVSNNIVLQGQYSPGSVNAEYTVTSTYPLDADLTTNFSNILNTISGSPLVISGSVTILSGSTIGSSRVYVNYDYNNLTEESSFASVVFDISGSSEYGFTVEASSGTVFDVTPTPTPSTTPPATPTQTPTNTTTPTYTPSRTPNVTPTKTTTPTNTTTRTPTPTLTKTPTPTPTKPGSGIVAGYTIYLNPANYAGATGNIGASAVTLNDASGNNYNATITPAASTYIEYYKSGALSYFQFNGTTARWNAGTALGEISIPSFTQSNISANSVGWNSSGVATNTYTTSHWFYTTGQNASAGGTIGLWEKGDSSDLRTQYTYGGYQARLGWHSNILNVVTGTTWWSINNWINVTMVVSGTQNVGVNNVKLYIAGLPVTTLTPSNTAINIGVGSAATTVLKLLSGNNNVFAYTVRYGQTLFYNNTALTDAQVLQNYNFQKTSYGL